MTWQILICISVLFYSVSILLQRSLIKTDSSHPKAFAILFQLLNGIIIGLYGFFHGSLVLPDLKTLIVPLLAMIVLYGLGNVFIFKALKDIDASRFTIIFALRALVTVTISLLFFGEQLTLLRYLGITLILVGVFMVNSKALRLTLTKQELPALLAALMFGLANANDRFLLQSFELYTFVTLAFILPALGLLCSDMSVLKPLGALLKWRSFKQVVILSMVYAVSAVSFFAALQRSETASQVVTASLSSVVVIVIFAAVILKERESLYKKIAASIITFIGLVLVS